MCCPCLFNPVDFVHLSPPRVRSFSARYFVKLRPAPSPLVEISLRAVTRRGRENYIFDYNHFCVQFDIDSNLLNDIIISRRRRIVYIYFALFALRPVFALWISLICR